MKSLRKIWLMLPFALGNVAALACEVCQKQQPKVLRGIAHGGGPQNNLDYVAVWCMVAVVAVSTVFAIKWILRPGEKERSHIKRSILNFD